MFCEILGFPRREQDRPSENFREIPGFHQVSHSTEALKRKRGRCRRVLREIPGNPESVNASPTRIRLCIIILLFQVRLNVTSFAKITSARI